MIDLKLADKFQGKYYTLFLVLCLKYRIKFQIIYNLFHLNILSNRLHIHQIQQELRIQIDLLRLLIYLNL